MISMMGREEHGEGKELLMIQSIPPHQWSMVVVVSVELVPLYLLMMWQKQQDEMSFELESNTLSFIKQLNERQAGDVSTVSPQSC